MVPALMRAESAARCLLSGAKLGGAEKLAAKPGPRALIASMFVSNWVRLATESGCSKVRLGRTEIVTTRRVNS